MRVDLDESVETIAKEILDGVMEKHGLAQIFGPVGGAKRGPVLDLAGDRGINRQSAIARVEVREKRGKLLTKRLDVEAVGGNVDRNAAAEDFFFLKIGESVLDGVSVSGKNGGI